MITEEGLFLIQRLAYSIGLQSWLVTLNMFEVHKEHEMFKILNKNSNLKLIAKIKKAFIKLIH